MFEENSLCSNCADDIVGRINKAKRKLKEKIILINVCRPGGLNDSLISGDKFITNWPALKGKGSTRMLKIPVAKYKSLILQKK